MITDAEIYHVETVETATPPRDADEGKWCRYVVASQRSRIVGRFRGSLTQARRNAEDLAEGLNIRAQSGKSAWTPRAQTRRKKRSV